MPATSVLPDRLTDPGTACRCAAKVEPVLQGSSEVIERVAAHGSKIPVVLDKFQDRSLVGQTAIYVVFPGARYWAGECNLKTVSLVETEQKILFALHRFVDHNLTAFFHIHHPMDGFVSGESNVNDVVALIEHEFHGRGLIQHAPVDAYLGSFWLGLDVDRAHVSRAVSTALEKLLEFANRFDVVYVAKHPECGSEMECLTGLKICGCGFVQVTLLPDKEGMRPLVHGDLGGSGSSAILAVNEN